MGWQIKISWLLLSHFPGYKSIAIHLLICELCSYIKTTAIKMTRKFSINIIYGEGLHFLFGEINPHTINECLQGVKLLEAVLLAQQVDGSELSWK